MIDNAVVDIAGDYKSRLFKDGLSFLQPGFATNIATVYDRYKKQFYLRLWSESPEIDICFAYSQKNGSWIGTNDFKFDRYTVDGQKTYGHRDFETYELNKGYIINGQPVEFSVYSAAAPESDKDKEFIRIRINSSKKPTNVQFFKEKGGAVQCSLNQATQGAFYLKNYRGWENLIGRIDASVNPNRPLLQGRLIVFGIFHNLAEEFSLSDTTIQFKKIK
jgi:hypothetical protein